MPVYPAPYARYGHGYATGFKPMNSSLPIKNNGGTIIGTGSTSGPMALVSQLGPQQRPNNNTVPGPKLRTGTAQPIPAGTFNNQVAGNYMIKGGSFMSSLAGVSSTNLNTTARLSSFNKSINSLTYHRSPNIASWDLLTGQPTYNTIAVVKTSFGADTAATPTNTVPGYLSYIVGLSPVTDYYNPRYLW